MSSILAGSTAIEPVGLCSFVVVVSRCLAIVCLISRADADAKGEQQSFARQCPRFGIAVSHALNVASRQYVRLRMRLHSPQSYKPPIVWQWPVAPMVVARFSARGVRGGGILNRGGDFGQGSRCTWTRLE